MCYCLYGWFTEWEKHDSSTIYDDFYGNVCWWDRVHFGWHIFWDSRDMHSSWKSTVDIFLDRRNKISKQKSTRQPPTIKITKISFNKICYSFDHISFKFKPLRKVLSVCHSWLSYLIAVCSSNPGSIIGIFFSSSEYLIRIYAVKQLKLYISFWFNYSKRIISIAKSSLVCLTTFLVCEVVIAAFSFTRLTLVSPIEDSFWYN